MNSRIINSFNKLNKDSHHLFIIGSPLHLMFAIEAKLTMGEESSIDLFVFYTLCDNNNKQLDLLLNTYKGLWCKVVSIKMIRHDSPVSSIKFLYDLTLISKKLPNYNLVFLSDPRVESFQIFISFLNYQELVLSDDGLATIQIYKDFLHNKRILINSKSKSLVRKIAYFIFRIHLKEPEKISFYSLFDLHNIETSLCKLYRCDFNNIRNLVHKNTTDSYLPNRHFFIGQKLVDAHIITESEYIKMLNNYINQYLDPNDVLIYIPHRGESKKVINKLKLNEKINILYLDQPIELYFLQESIVPMSLASFYSTALITLSLILKQTKIQAIQLSEESLLPKVNVTNINGVYGVLSTYVPLITVGNLE